MRNRQTFAQLLRPCASLLAAASIGLLLLSGVVSAQVIKGTVTHVEDGDTLTMTVGSDRYVIRLADIDAPETCHKQRDRQCLKPGQPHGKEAGRALATLAMGKEATARCRGASYDRTVCYVEVNGQDVSLTLAHAGLVWWEPKYGRNVVVRAAADAARQRGLGVWSTPGAVEPWIWRKQCWSGQVCPGAVSE